MVHKQPLNFIELEGSFVYFMDVTGDILIWNWEEDTFGVLDVGEQFGTESVCSGAAYPQHFLFKFALLK